MLIAAFLSCNLPVFSRFFRTDAHDRTDLGYPARRYYRKRLREGNPFRKNFYKFATVNSVAPVVPAVSGSANVEGGIVERQYVDSPAYSPYGPATRPKTTLFDDIFNVSINHLLRARVTGSRMVITPNGLGNKLPSDYAPFFSKYLTISQLFADTNLRTDGRQSTAEQQVWVNHTRPREARRPRTHSCS